MGGRRRFAFCLFEYVPFGGMQDNLLRIARECAARGHLVDIFARYWEGTFPDDLNVAILQGRGLTNHSRCESFAQKLNRVLSTRHYDLKVGFNKMPGLDVYYAADSCFAAKADERGFLYRLTGRCRSYLRLERAVFERGSGTVILLLSEREKKLFQRYYGTEEERFHLLPPGISRDRMAPDNRVEIRSQLRQEITIPLTQNVVLMVGSGFKTKGVDRAIRALSSLPGSLKKNTTLLVVGDDKTGPFRRLARRLHVDDHVIFVGGRTDVPRFLAAADLLLHPSYRENTGTVLIEAMAAGLPVLATDVCGYGHHILHADAGQLIPSPFRQETLNEMLAQMLTSDRKKAWRHNGMKYVSRIDVFSRHEKAADIIEQVAGCW